jgi:hypothetical protein
MSSHQHENPDHGELARLAREDPAAFDALRLELIDEMIARAPDEMRPRLAGLQFRLDHIRRKSRSSLGATVKIYQLMWQSFLDLRHQLYTFRAPLENPASTARILDFRPRKHLGAG